MKKNFCNNVLMIIIIHKYKLILTQEFDDEKRSIRSIIIYKSLQAESLMA